jgi:crotonobetainyl-CoA:carnitine CoA-transferase CaiB-like acyl-CoA transferase
MSPRPSMPDLEVNHALGGLTVVDLSWGLAGALASLVLADFGAEVVRVEPPGGDVLRKHPAFPFWGRGKKSAVLDLGSEGGRREARQLAERADVLLVGFRPGAAERLGLGYAELAMVNPGLIYTSITGFGTRGPYAHVQGYEGVVVAKMGGMAHVAGMAPRPGPAFTAAPYASFGAAQLALQGMLAALYLRERTGRGQRVETSLAQGLAAHDPWEWFLRILCERYPEAYTPAPPYSERGVPASGFAFRLLVCLSKDGRWLQFSQTSPHLFEAFLKALGLEWMREDPAWRTAPDFETEAERERFWEILLEAARQKTVAEWDEISSKEPNVWAEVFRTTREALDHRQMRHNGHVVRIDDPHVGPTEQLGPLVRMMRTPAAPRCASRLGEHTETVLASPVAERIAARETRPLPRRALEGVTILELGLWYAAPYGSALLADLGARVIKIEPLAGEPMRHIMPVPDAGAIKVLQGKESVAVDLDKPEGREIVRRLAGKADLALVSYRAGVAERLGVDYPSLRAANPRLVYLNAPGYGIDGPCARKPAFAPTIGAAAGAGLLQAGPSIPHGAGLDLETIKQASIRLNWAAQAPGNADGCSALAVGTALLLGLVARERTGEAQEMLTSMLCSTSYALSDDAVRYAGQPPRPSPDPLLHGMSALYRLYETSEGWIFLACPQEKEWQRLSAALSAETNLAADPRFRTPDARDRHDDALANVLAAIFRRRTAAEWEERLVPAAVACVEVAPGPVARAAMNDPVFREAGFLAEVEHPTFGRHRRLAPLVDLSLTPGEARPAPTLGMHTGSVLREIGYGDREIEALSDRGVVLAAG